MAEREYVFVLDITEDLLGKIKKCTSKSPCTITIRKGKVITDEAGKDFMESLSVDYAYSRWNASEYGKGGPISGSATIVCGTDGRPLRPFKLNPKTSSDRSNYCASFVSKSLIEVRSSHERGEFEIEIVKYINEEQGKILWRENIGYVPTTGDRVRTILKDKLPSALNNLLEAALASIKKSREVQDSDKPYYYDSSPFQQ